MEHSNDPRQRNECNLIIQEILAEAMPYTSCDLEQAQELRDQLVSQMMILSGLGKAQSVEVFQHHIRDVEFHIETKKMETAMKEKMLKDSKLSPSYSDDAPYAKDRPQSINQLQKENRKKRASGRSRWVIGMEDDAVTVETITEKK